MSNCPKLKSVIFPNRISLIWENAILLLPEGTSIKGKVVRANGFERELENETVGNNIVMNDEGVEPCPVGKYTFILTHYRVSPYAPLFPQKKMEIEIIEEE